MPPVSYSSNGALTISNDTMIAFTVINNTWPQLKSVWGMPYASMNYMLVDIERRTFKMAPARRGGSGAINSAILSIGTICGPAVTPTGYPRNSTAASAAAKSHSYSRSHAGAIAGSVVGGVLGLFLIACGFGYLFWRRNRKKKAVANQQQRYEKHGGAIAEMASNGCAERHHRSRRSGTNLPIQSTMRDR